MPFVWVKETVNQARVAFARESTTSSQLDSVVQELVRTRNAVRAQRVLLGLLEVREEAQRHLPAGRVSRDLRLSGPTAFSISVGSDDGVQLFDPVVALGALFGQIRGVSASRAWGVDVLNPTFAVAAMTMDGGVQGIMEASGEAEPPFLTFSGMTGYSALLSPGTELVTSGAGGVYPAGILVGRIHAALPSPDWNRSYSVSAALQPSHIDHALVLTRPADLLAGESSADFPVSGPWDARR